MPRLHLASHTAIVDFESGRRIPAPEILTFYERTFGLTPGALAQLRDDALAARAGGEAGKERRRASPVAERAVPRLLPPPPRVFSGRSRELAVLDHILGPDADRDAVVPLAVVRGTAGIGKTALALRWAHANSALFPDGQLHINLRGFDPADPPLEPEVALRAFLSVLGAPAPAVPSDVHAMTARYRSLIAGKRILIVLDNVYDSAQATPLLPGDSACTALITSRHQLSGLVAAHGAVPVELGALAQDEARQLLVGHVGLELVNAEPEAARALLDFCAGMPLALAILAGRAASRPGSPLAALAREMAEATYRLDILDAGEVGVDARAVFACSYRGLSPAAVEALGLLSQVPGPDIGLPAAAALLDLASDGTRQLLRDLEYAHLIEQRQPKRYRMHDLVRLYSAEHGLTAIPEHTRAGALRRLAEHYQATARIGESPPRPHGEKVNISRPDTARV